jgi:hypothetical protein
MSPSTSVIALMEDLAVDATEANSPVDRQASTGP